MTRLRFTKRQRLRDSMDFQRVYAENNRAGDSFLLVFAARNDFGWTRIGLSVSKKKHGSAVQRSQIKRRLREAFRLAQYELAAGLDLVVIPRPKSGASVSDYQDSLIRLTRILARRLFSEERP